ncbi:MAG TPA: amidohydrolase, partial [Vicinamibacteria bacterium]|nr:amidohydrolase [Vicinamibacteria bacterium]
EYEVIHGIYALLPNETLGRAMHANLERVGGVVYTDEERRFAEKVRESFTGEVPPLSSAGEIEKFEVREEGSGGSTDVGDVSWVVPTAGMRAATYVPGTPGHSWQAIASGGSTIGNKGMVVAAKTLTLTAIDLFEDPEIVAEAKREWQGRVGPDFVYQSLVGDRPPPLDYRKPATP